MDLNQIENLSAKELKAKRDELIEAAAKAVPKELAARYIKARTDAALRDEKLAEQGQTITNLNSSLNTAHAANDQQAKALRDQADQIDGLKKHAVHLQNELTAIEDQRDAVKAERDQLAKLAKHRRAALADVMQLANGVAAKVAPLLAEES